MPINAHPEFFQAEARYNNATTNQEKIAGLEEMLRTAPNHKGSESLRAEIKQKLSKLRSQLEKVNQTSKGKSSKFTVKREGTAQVVFVSVANAGKSSLLGKITNAKPLVAEYKFTTTKPEVGIMDYKGINIQIIEMPAMFKGFAYKGDGPAMFSVIRSVDLIVFLIDSTQDEQEQLDILYSEFDKAQIKLNANKPKVFIRKQGFGGIEFLGKRYFQFDSKEAVKMLTTQGYHNAIVTAFEPITIEDLADVVNESIVYLPLIIVHTKSDLTGKGISSVTGEGLDQFKENIFKTLRLIKVYTKSPGKNRDWPPVAMQEGDTIKSLAKKIHKDFFQKFKYARIWGTSAKHASQVVGLEHELQDEDIVEFHQK